MIRFLFDNDKKKNKLTKKFQNKKVTRAELFVVVAGMYILAKAVVRHELEVTNLKKAIEEIKSKGV